MKLDLAAALNAALAIWRRDRDMLLRIGGVFFFLPLLAAGLYIVPSPPAEGAPAPDSAEMLHQLGEAAIRTAPWSLLIAVFAAFGSAMLYTIFLTQAATVGDALREGARRFAALFLATIAVRFVFLGGLLLFILPGLYLLGRTYLTGPALIAERRGNPIDAIARSFALTRGHGLVLMAVSLAIMLAGQLPALLLSDLRAAAMTGGSENPVTAILLVGAAAAAGLLASLADQLVKVTVYRRLA